MAQLHMESHGGVLDPSYDNLVRSEDLFPHVSPDPTVPFS